MKASELINKIQSFIDAEGDVEVFRENLNEYDSVDENSYVQAPTVFLRSVCRREEDWKVLRIIMVIK